MSIVAKHRHCDIIGRWIHIGSTLVFLREQRSSCRPLHNSILYSRKTEVRGPIAYVECAMSSTQYHGSPTPTRSTKVGFAAVVLHACNVGKVQGMVGASAAHGVKAAEWRTTRGHTAVVGCCPPLSGFTPCAAEAPFIPRMFPTLATKLLHQIRP